MLKEAVTDIFIIGIQIGIRSTVKKITQIGARFCRRARRMRGKSRNCTHTSDTESAVAIASDAPTRETLFRERKAPSTACLPARTFSERSVKGLELARVKEGMRKSVSRKQISLFKSLPSVDVSGQKHSACFPRHLAKVPLPRTEFSRNRFEGKEIDR